MATRTQPAKREVESAHAAFIRATLKEMIWKAYLESLSASTRRGNQDGNESPAPQPRKIQKKQKPASKKKPTKRVSP